MKLAVKDENIKQNFFFPPRLHEKIPPYIQMEFLLFL